MKTVYVDCNLCGSDDWLLRFPATLQGNEQLNAGVFRCTSTGYGQHPQIVQCRYCDYVYANPRWESDELLHAYNAVEDETYVTERTGRELTFSRHLQALEQVIGPARGRRLLDVGAYIGVFVEVALEAGWDACGIEPSAWAVREAEARNLPVIEGTQETLQGANGSFDVITMWDVIEHVADPAAELTRAHRLLKPGGVIAVHTMDVESIAARLLGERWPWLMEMHIHYFSRRTLAQMLQKQGFEPLWCGAQGRYLRLGYLTTRLEALHGLFGHWAAELVHMVGAEQWPVPVNLGDLFTMYARRPAK